MNTYIYNANSLIEATEKRGRTGAPIFWNFHFKTLPGYDKTAMQGCGLYCVAYEGRAIYIGKFLGTAKNPAEGNILPIRWLKHLASFSMRGHQLSISTGALNRFILDTTDMDPVNALRHADPNLITRDQGCMASYNRVMFAAQKWADFQRNPETFLNKFELGYVQLDAKEIEPRVISEIRKEVSAAEATARKRFQLCCNGESDFNMAWLAPSLNISEVLNFFESLLGDRTQKSQINPVSPLIVLPEGRSSEESDISLERIEDDLPDGWPTDLLEKMRVLFNNANVEVHATATGARGDVRVRVNDLRRPRNVFTMAWQPRLNKFQCLILNHNEALLTTPGIHQVKPAKDNTRLIRFKWHAADQPDAAINGLLTRISETIEIARRREKF